MERDGLVVLPMPGRVPGGRVLDLPLAVPRRWMWIVAVVLVETSLEGCSMLRSVDRQCQK